MDIPIPAVSFDTKNFSSDTMMAQCALDGSAIYIKKYSKPNPDQLFAIAHELFHIWQIENNNPLYFSEYKSVELCDSVEAYNLQIAEIDANAFAGLVMVEFFHLKPLFEGVSDIVKNRIYERMEYLKTIL